MKKFYSLLLTAALLLALCSCASKDQEAPTVPETTMPVITTTEAATEATETDTEVSTEAPTETTEAPTEAEKGLWGTVVNTKSLNVRQEPGKENPSLGQLNSGSRVEILEQAAIDGVGWGRINYNGEEGWVCMTYVKLDSAPTETTAPTEAHVHDYTDKDVISATCTQRGYTRYTCKCGAYYDASYTAALGHDWGSWTTTVAPTATTSGTQQRKCSRCSEVETKVLPATGSTDQPTTQPTDPPATEPTPTETQSPQPTECQHNWVHHHEDEIAHTEYFVRCYCGAKFSTNAEWITHTKNYDAVEALTNHGGHSSGSERVVDSPAKDWDECTICGATK